MISKKLPPSAPPRHWALGWSESDFLFVPEEKSKAKKIDTKPNSDITPIKAKNLCRILN